MRYALYIQGQRVTVEGVELELSQTTGALIIVTANTRAWQHMKVDLYTGGERYDFQEKRSASLAQHRINGLLVSAAIFSGLASGEYRAFASGIHAQISAITIHAGEVSQIHWI